MSEDVSIEVESLMYLQGVPHKQLMSNDGVQQLWQTERNVCIVVRVSVKTPPLFKAGQNLLNITELLLDVREYRLGPLQDIIWRDGGSCSLENML